MTIADDDVPAPPPLSFTIGGTVDGLQGSGLVLDDIGTELAPGNGPFTFPRTRADGLPYDVKVKTQPSSPDQVCTVSHGAGTVTGADVTDVAVHCATPAPSAGLDPVTSAEIDQLIIDLNKKLGITSVVVGLEDVSMYPQLIAELLRRGYSDDDIRKIAGRNILRVLRQAEEVARRIQTTGR